MLTFKEKPSTCIELLFHNYSPYNQSLYMKKPLTFTLLPSIIALATLLTVFGASHAAAEERSAASASLEADVEAVEAAPANYNNTRSNRSSVASPEPDTNVACGSEQVRCPDGSCRTSQDMCVVESESADFQAELSTIESPTRCTEAGDCDDARGSVKPGEAMMNTDEDGYDDASDRAQNHNSSRSNRTSAVAAPGALDSDDDGDGIPMMRTEAVDDKATPLLFDRLRASDNDPVQPPIIFDAPVIFDAIEASVQGEVSTDEETNEPKLTQVSVSAEDMRAWDDDERTAFQQVLAEAPEGTPEQASLQIAAQALDDERVESLEASETGASARYRARLRLFGIIPIERTVEARTSGEGEVEVDYPWYRFLSSTPDTGAIRDLLTRAHNLLR
jgi:hypothetical protein